MTVHPSPRRGRRRPARHVVATYSLFTLILLAAAGLSGADCPTAGVAGVRIAYIDLDGNGVPDVESSDKERNERARLSSSLAAQLGISVPAGADVFPQIRVIAENQDLATGDPAMGVFSVFEVYTSSTAEIEVYADEDTSDDESGEYRLFEDVTVADLSAVRLTAYPQAVSSTTITTGGGSPELTRHYCEPASYSRFIESAAIEDDKRFALLVPHGGEIEGDTSEQVGTIVSTLAGRGVAANTWDVQGYWHDDEDESEHWHITSDEVTATGFPGLAALLAEPAYESGRQFQYAASLHGMSYDAEGMILGGRASREAKCLIASRVRTRMADEGLPVPAVFIWNYDKDEDLSIELPHSDPDEPTITEDRGDDPGVSGTSRDNIVNRLSPNENGAPGFGGVQIEQSPDLRDDDPLPQFLPASVSYRDLVAEEIADAFGELLTKPGLVVPGSTAICDTLVAGEPLPAAEIRGRAWRDLDGGDERDPSDPAMPGLEVELVDGSGAVVDSALTDAAGLYAFPGLAQGSYRLRLRTSAVFELVDRDQAGGDDALDSDLDPATETSDLLVLGSDDLVEDLDAGLALAAGTAEVGDFVWRDAVANGVQDGLDEPLGGVAVTLLDEDGSTVAATVTDAGGYYSFPDLPAATYRLRFMPEPGYEPVAAGQGQDAGLDSDVDASFEAEVALGAGVQDLDIDAGFTIGCFDATLIAFGSSWSWSTAEESGWQQIAFDDGAWDHAQASLGYRLSILESEITDGGTVAYFRLPFEVEDPSLYDQLDLLLYRNDGAVVYLNGLEVLRSNVPLTGAGTATVGAVIDGSDLVEGTNVLAVEVHETDGTLAFDLALSARVCRPCVTSEVLTADRVTYVRHDSDTVRGGRTMATMDASTEESALFAWPAGDLPDDAEVLHAEIRWRVTDDSSDVFHLYPLLVNWDEGTAHWYRRSGSPDVPWALAGANDADADYRGDEPLAAIRFTDDPPFSDPPYTGTVLLNLAGREWVQGWARGERGNHGIVVPGEGGGNKLEVDSDDGLQPPVLEVVYRSCTP